MGGSLQYAGLIAISLAISFWFWIFLVNGALALLWLVWPLHSDSEVPWVAALQSALTFINRHVGHIEVLAVWIVLALVSADRLPIQLCLLALVLFVGEPVLKRVAAKDIPDSAITLQTAITQRMPTRNLLDILINMEHWTNFTRHFGPLSGTDPKLDRAAERYLQTVFAIAATWVPRRPPGIWLARCRRTCFRSSTGAISPSRNWRLPNAS